MKNLKLFTRFVTLVTIWSLVIGSGWMLPTDAEARQVSGRTRTNVNAAAMSIVVPMLIATLISIVMPMLIAIPMSIETPT